MQYELQYRVKRDIIIRNQKNTFRNSLKLLEPLLEPEESDQRKVFIFLDTVEGYTSSNHRTVTGQPVLFFGGAIY